PRARVPPGAPPPREARRLGLPRRPSRGGDPAPRPDHERGRRLRRPPHPPLVQGGVPRREVPRDPARGGGEGLVGPRRRRGPRRRHGPGNVGILNPRLEIKKPRRGEPLRGFSYFQTATSSPTRRRLLSC